MCGCQNIVYGNLASATATTTRLRARASRTSAILLNLFQLFWLTNYYNNFASKRQFN